jgi:precorrin-6B methylase 2
MTALETWAQELGSWAIPEAILRAAPESPWGFPRELFARRGMGAATSAVTPTTRVALEALPQGGDVVDVGVGGGGTSLPLAGRAGRIVGVDGQTEMLESFAENARAAGVDAGTVEGRWPDVERQVPVADVVVAGHVLYNVPDLGPFVLALDRHARRRVVLEAPDRHPMAWMNDLWLRFHGLRRPEGPTMAEAIAALEECGLDPERQDRESDEDQTGTGFERREDAVALVRRRLCLPPKRDPEVAEALGDRLAVRGGLWSTAAGGQTIVTLWWDVDRA